jgi:hypothetical protein
MMANANRLHQRSRRLCLRLVLLLFCALPLSAQEAALPQWWKGNLHTHSVWSDGDDFPEMIADWYKRNGYHFLSFTEHNVVPTGTRWVNLNTHTRAAGAFQRYRETFGEGWVEQRHREDGHFVRLKPLSEFRHRFEEPGRFMLVMGEEITDVETVHINAIHLQRLIEPQGGETVVEIIQNNVDAVKAQREETGQPMFPFINHPNFRWAITAEDIGQVRGASFFEVYNGHLGVNNEGDEQRASTERMWDIILTLWHDAGRREPILGLATDDAHNYRPDSPLTSRPGRGWIMVRASYLTPESIVYAMEAGDFYSSTGVVLRDIRQEGNRLTLEIEPEAGVTYTTQFIGTRSGYDPTGIPVADQDGNPIRTTRQYAGDIGHVLQEVHGTTAHYTFRGDEIYVRAKVISSKPKQDPTSQEVLGMERAWTQPFLTEN